MSGYDENIWFDTRSVASLPGGLEIDRKKLEWFRRRLNWGYRFIGSGRAPAERWATHLMRGLAESAMVVSLKPLIVSVYTVEFDCVAMLRFAGLPERLALKDGDRLLSVNTFASAPKADAKTRTATTRDGRGAAFTQESIKNVLDADLIAGPGTHSVWVGVHPVIADFVAADASAVEARKRELDERSWRRLEELTPAYRKRFPGRARDGNPYLSHMPAAK